ncbi:MAG TPA: ADP-ribosylation factor-directed GTPase activating protein isoform b [Pirellulales bacterium]|nr:ADP-ribosylation factor-directed GTPase activating protein isoform b [Pirellulales bacterium]
MLRSFCRRRFGLLLYCLPLVVPFVAGCSDGGGTKASNALANLEANSGQSSSTELVVPDRDTLCKRVELVIEQNGRRHMSPQVNNAWQIVHGMLAYGYDLQLNDGGKLVGGIDWLFDGGQMRGWQLVPGEKGLKDIEEPGSKVGEGHDDQWLGYFAQCGVPHDAKIKVRSEEFTIDDMVKQSQWDVREGMEATWTLMAFSVYLPLDTKWQARDGSEWSIERLLEMECKQDLASSTCGGTHRMYGIATTLNRHLNEGGKIEGIWLLADQKIKQAIDDAQVTQQPDGGFSTNYFSRSGMSPEIGLRINTTGHVLEFICLAASESQLQQPWVTRAVSFLCDLLEQTQDVPVECGGLYHAVHGLMLYRDRRCGAR